METHSQTLLTKALELVLDVICIVDVEGRFVAVSAACEEVFGYAPAELVGTPMLDLVYPADREHTLAAAAGVMDGQPLRNFENRYVRKDGEVIDIMWSASWSPEEQLRLAVAREVTVRKRAESMQAALYGISEAAHSAADLADLFRRIHRIVGDMLPAGSFIVALRDADSAAISYPYLSGEQQLSHMFWWPEATTFAEQVMRSGVAVLQSPHAADRLPRQARAAVDAERVDWLGVPLIANHRTIGALVLRSASAAVRYGEQHRSLLQFVSTQIAANIERKQANQRLQYLAQYDVLTGLPNRTLFTDRLQVALARAARHQDRLALLYIDLDNFKPVNDRFGHTVGDLLLQEVASRIRACVRESDTVCRIGGDEFVVLLDTVRSPQCAADVAENIRAALNRSFQLSERRLQIAASIGVASYPEHGAERTQLMRNADAAMYAAKYNGGNQCLLFSGQGSRACA